MTADTVALALGAFFASAFLKGITGLGFSTICLGLIASLIDIKLAIPLVLLPSLSSNVLVMIDAGRFHESLARFWILFLSALPGLGLGLWLLNSVPTDVARLVLGGVLFVYGLWGLWGQARTEAGQAPAIGRYGERRWNPLVGFLTGTVNGLTGSQVMPVLPYLIALKLDKELFVQTINISFTASSLVMLAGLANLGLLSWSVAGVSAVGIVPVALGIWLGGKIRRRIPDALFTRIVLALLVVLGLNLMARTVL